MVDASIPVLKDLRCCHGVNKVWYLVLGIFAIAKRLALISAGAKGRCRCTCEATSTTVVMGVNATPSGSVGIVSNGSCTTNCLTFVVKSSMITLASKRRDDHDSQLGRSADSGPPALGQATGACSGHVHVQRAQVQQKPSLSCYHLEGKFGMAVRVPPNVSLVDMVIETREEITAEGVNQVKAQQRVHSKVSSVLKRYPL